MSFQEALLALQIQAVKHYVKKVRQQIKELTDKERSNIIDEFVAEFTGLAGKKAVAK
jgi:hypothetical protein